MTSVEPVYFRGLDLIEIVNLYLNDKFATLSTPLPVDLSILNNKEPNILAIREKFNRLNSYEIEVGAGQSFACIGYKIYETDGKYGPYKANGNYNCMYCLRQVKTKPMGIPILREEHDGKIYFHMIDVFCTFNCIFSELHLRHTNVLYSNSFGFLSEIFNKCTGKDITELHPCSDRRLLTVWNGPMSYEEYHKASIPLGKHEGDIGKHLIYSEKPGNVYFVSTVEYIQQDN